MHEQICLACTVSDVEISFAGVQPFLPFPAVQLEKYWNPGSTLPCQ